MRTPAADQVVPSQSALNDEWDGTHDGAAAVARIATSAAMMQALAAAVELRLVDALVDGPAHSDALAQRLQCNCEALRRLLRALAAFGFCEECEPNVFGATSAGSVLRTSGDRSLHHWVLWFARYLWPEWAELTATVRTGRSGRSLSRGAHGMNHLDNDREAARIFDGAMAELTRRVGESVPTHSALSRAGTIVDIGGGSGELLCAILQRHTRAHGILFDRAHAIDRARETLRAAGLASRCDLVSGDFFRCVPKHGDVYILKSVIHDWNDLASETILRLCRDAMNPEGRILIIEHLMPERLTRSVEHQDIARRDLTMMIGPGGRERTEAQFHDLLARCGLRCGSLTRAAAGFSVIEAIPTEG